MKNVEWYTAQVNADIIAIDAKIAQATSDIETLNAEKVELVKVLGKLKAVITEPLPP